MNAHQKNLIRREAFVQGFVAARAPRNPRDTLLTLEEAERAFGVFLDQRENGGNTDKDEQKDQEARERSCVCEGFPRK